MKPLKAKTQLKNYSDMIGETQKEDEFIIRYINKNWVHNTFPKVEYGFVSPKTLKPKSMMKIKLNLNKG